LNEHACISIDELTEAPGEIRISRALQLFANNDDAYELRQNRGAGACRACWTRAHKQTGSSGNGDKAWWMVDGEGETLRPATKNAHSSAWGPMCVI